MPLLASVSVSTAKILSLADEPRALVYGRVGACTQEFGGLTLWLIYCLNVLTGHLDRPAMLAELGHHVVHDTNTGISNTKLAMWLFLGSECLLFGGLITTFLLYKHPLPGTGPSPHELYDIPFTSISSFVLLMSSLTMVLAVSAIERGDKQRFHTWIVGTAMLGCVFIAGQVYEFTAFKGEGMGFTTSRSCSARTAPITSPPTTRTRSKRPDLMKALAVDSP